MTSKISRKTSIRIKIEIKTSTASMLLFKMIHSKLVWLTATRGSQEKVHGNPMVRLMMPLSDSSNKFLFRNYSVR